MLIPLTAAVQTGQEQAALFDGAPDGAPLRTGTRRPCSAGQTNAGRGKASGGATPVGVTLHSNLPPGFEGLMGVLRK